MTRVIENIKNFLDNKSILILGFGREGKSTYDFIKRHVSPKTIAISDKDKLDIAEKTYSGEDYLKYLNDYDVVIKSPGIPFVGINYTREGGYVTSQTDLLLMFNKENMIGITGTKGKSTTSSLIYAILQEAKVKSKLIGNIGIPPFTCLEEIDDDTTLVCEMSSHQLEHVKNSPHIAVLLNIFEEHLDHYASYEDYQLAKVNIFRYQAETDSVIYCKENELVNKYVEKYARANKYSFPYEFNPESNLIGEHNKKNIMAAARVAELVGVSETDILSAIRKFNGLSHRLEYVGEFDGVKYYNDSISTIPEATIMAVESLKDVDTLIAGGLDRGIDYSKLIDYLQKSPVSNIILAYATGGKIFKSLSRSGIKLVEDLEEAVKVAKAVTAKGKICVLSPAAASYGYFKNFEERGEKFKEYVKNNG